MLKKTELRGTVIESIFTITIRVWAVLSRNVLTFLVVHLCFTVLTIFLFTPLLGLLFRLAMHFSSRQVLADTDIILFLLSPYGIVVLITFSALLLTIVIFELGVMMAAYIAAADGIRIPVIHLLRGTLSSWLHILKFSIFLALRLLMIVAPFLAAAAAIYFLALGRHDINYYLSTRPPVFIGAAVLIVIIVLMMLLVLIVKLLSWSLTLPLILFQREKPKKSFSTSAVIVGGGKKLVALVLSAWGLSIFLLGFLLASTFRLSSYYLIPPFYDSMPLLVGVIGLLFCLLFLANFLLTGLASASFSGLIIELGRSFSLPVSIDYLSTASDKAPSNLSLPRMALFTIIGLVASLGVGFWLVNSLHPAGDVAVVAHRGAAGRAPENTIASVRAAIEDQADWVEIDVQESRDGEIVVIHDSDFMKLAGLDLKVWEGSMAQIGSVDVGSWFGSDYSGERVPTLADVLDECAGRTRVLIELKYYGHDRQLEQRVVDIVEKSEMVNDVAIMSLKFNAIQKIRKLRPDWTVGLLSAQVIGSMANLDVDFLAVNRSMASRAFVASNQAAGKKVFVWTINDRLALFTMLSLGVDGIITDEPALAQRIMAEYAERNPVERLLLSAAVRLGQPLPGKRYRDQSP